MKIYLYPILLCASLFCFSFSYGSTPILIWGDTKHVTGSDPLVLSGTPVVEDHVAKYSYSWDTPLSPGAGYTGPTFYGTLEAHAGAKAIEDGLVPGFSQAQLLAGAQTRMRIDAENVNSATTPRGTLRGLIFFKKEDFIGGASGSGAIVQFDESSTISLNASSLNSSPRHVHIAVHARIGDSWEWYLSETRVTVAGTLEIANAGAENWAVWGDISAEGLLPAAPTSGSYTIAGSSFDDIDAVGYHIFMTNSSNGSSHPFMQFGEFSVAAATTIPEPAHALLLVVLALAGMSIYGRKRSCC